ncbi:MAG: hypothetical protein R2744_03215 [Bacteroidales bacterium]
MKFKEITRINYISPFSQIIQQQIVLLTNKQDRRLAPPPTVWEVSLL